MLTTVIALIKKRGSLIAAFLVTIFCFGALGLEAPRLIPFQGRLTDQNGLSISNGARLVQFKIYDVPTGANPIWAGELHRTSVNGGLVNALLGTKTPFTSVDFDQQLYLEITVDINGDNAISAADPPMLPRQAILPVVFAKESADSRLLKGYDWSALFGTNNPTSGTLLESKIRDGSINAAKLQPGTITSNQIANQTITAAQIGMGTITSDQLAARIVDALVPVGTVVSFAGLTVPSAGWLICDGSAVSRVQYPRLFNTIGTSWGVGDGTTTFNLPDLRGRAPIGAGQSGITDQQGRNLTNRILGYYGGEEIHQLTITELPSHNHSKQSWRGGYNSGGDWMWAWNSGNGNTGLQYTDNTGGNQPHNIMQPFAVINYIIKY